MKCYISYPISFATREDTGFREFVRDYLTRYPEIETYDPLRDEPEGLPIHALQEHDLEIMGTVDAVLVIWSRAAPSSAGVLAEIEWARRIFNIPVAIYRPDEEVRISPWTVATVEGRVFGVLEEAVAELKWALGEEVAA
jgi:hypothetical protein